MTTKIQDENLTHEFTPRHGPKSNVVNPFPHNTRRGLEDTSLKSNVINAFPQNTRRVLEDVSNQNKIPKNDNLGSKSVKKKGLGNGLNQMTKSNTPLTTGRKKPSKRNLHHNPKTPLRSGTIIFTGESKTQNLQEDNEIEYAPPREPEVPITTILDECMEELLKPVRLSDKIVDEGHVAARRAKGNDHDYFFKEQDKLVLDDSDFDFWNEEEDKDEQILEDEGNLDLSLDDFEVDLINF